MQFEIPLFSFGLNFFVYRWHSNVDFAKTSSENIPKSVSGKELVSTRHKKASSKAILKTGMVFQKLILKLLNRQRIKILDIICAFLLNDV